MRKSLTAAALLTATVFGVGYGIGQLRGITVGSAASWSTGTQPRAGPHGGFMNLGPRADGIVTAVNGDTITVKADSDQGQTNEYGQVTTIVLTNNTKYGFAFDSGTAATKASIKVGSFVMAMGSVSSDGKSLTATQASVRQGGPHANGRTGAPAFFGPGGNNTSGASV